MYRDIGIFIWNSCQLEQWKTSAISGVISYVWDYVRTFQLKHCFYLVFNVKLTKAQLLKVVVVFG